MLGRLLLCVGIVACTSSATDPTRDHHCMYSGDTVGQVKLTEIESHKVVSCFWVVATRTICGAGQFHPASQRTIPDCPKES